MKSVIPFKKVIEFKTKIAEITSISLEHEYVKKEGELSGDFIVEGEYKVHEVSVNKEKFKYRLPFSIELSDKVDLDSINFQILDFTYDIVDEDKLEIFIEFGVDAEEREEIFEPIEVEPVKEEIVNEEREELPKLQEDAVLEKEPIVEEVVTNDSQGKEVDTERNQVIELNQQEDSFVTYHIHILQEGESLESVCKLYNTTSAGIAEYNDLSNLVVGDKIIIPDYIDE